MMEMNAVLRVSPPHWQGTQTLTKCQQQGVREEEDQQEHQSYCEQDHVLPFQILYVPIVGPHCIRQYRGTHIVRITC